MARDLARSRAYAERFTINRRLTPTESSRPTYNGHWIGPTEPARFDPFAEIMEDIFR